MTFLSSRESRRGSDGPFASEVFLGALRAVSKDQIDTARALGMSEFVTLRLVILPQLIRPAPAPAQSETREDRR